MRAGCLVAAMLLAVGCGEDAPGDGGPGCLGAACEPPPPAVVSCPDQLVPMPGGAGCDARVTTDACAPGTMPRLGSDACEPVGWTTCPAGFALDLEVDPSGWGCRADLPAQACQGATRDALGEGCVPLGDCAAPFPPPDATHFVDAAFGPDELDATHWSTIGEAVEAAPDGAVIAIAPGTYAGSFAVPRPMTLAGACAADVELVGAGDGKLGILVTEVRGVVVRGVTLRGFVGGVAVDAAGSLRLEDVLLEDNELIGALASDAGTELSLVRSVVRGTTATPSGQPGSGVMVQEGARLDASSSAVVANTLAGVTALADGTVVRLERSVVRDGLVQTTGDLAGKGGFGVYVYVGGRAEIVESAILASRTAGVYSRKTGAGGEPSSVLLEQSEVRESTPDDAGELGRGIEASGGGVALVRSSTIATSTETNVMVTEGSQATVVGASLLGPSVGDRSPSGTGLIVGAGSQVEVESTAMLRPRTAGFTAQDDGALTVRGSLVADPLPFLDAEPGKSQGTISLYAYTGGSLEVEGSTVLGALGVGAFVKQTGSRLRLLGTLVADSIPDPGGLFGRAAGAQDGGVLVVERSALVRHRDVAVLVADGASEASFIDSVVGPTSHNSDGELGHAVVGQGGVRLVIEGTTLHGSVGIGLGLSASSAFVSRSFLSLNAVGIHVQEGSSLVEASDESVDPTVVVVTPDTTFFGNDTRVGSGVVPLPAPMAP